MAVIAMAALSAVLGVIAARDTCSGVSVEATPSTSAKRGIPARYLSLYRQAARESEVRWPALAAIGSLATGVTSGPLWIPTADERPPSAGPTARLAQRHLAWLERRGGAASTLISSPECELCPAHPHTPAPDDEVRASSPTSVH